LFFKPSREVRSLHSLPCIQKLEEIFLFNRLFCWSNFPPFSRTFSNTSDRLFLLRFISALNLPSTHRSQHGSGRLSRSSQ
jgi:hypothetical protein